MPTPSAHTHMQRNAWRHDECAATDECAGRATRAEARAAAPFVMMALVCAGTLNCTLRGNRSSRNNGCALPQACFPSGGRGRCAPSRLCARTSSAANLSTAVKGASSGTLNLRATNRFTLRALASRSQHWWGARRRRARRSHSEWELGVRRERNLERHLGHGRRCLVARASATGGQRRGDLGVL